MLTSDIAFLVVLTVLISAVFFRIVHLCLESDDVDLDLTIMVLTGFCFFCFVVSMWHTAIKNSI